MPASVSGPRAVGAAGDVLDDLTLEDPHLDANAAVGGSRGRGGIVHVGPQRVQRYPALAISLGAGDFGATETT